MSKADDMKNTHFKPFTDDTSGPEGERAVRDLKLHGNVPDGYAETYTDCMLGCDMGRGQLPLHCAGYLGLHPWLTETVNEIDAAGNVAAVLVRYAVLKGIVEVLWVSTDTMIADFLTKAADEATFIRCRAVLMNIKEEGKWLPSLRSSVKLKTQRLVAAVAKAIKGMD